MSTRAKVLINIAAIAFFVGAAVFLYRGIDELAQTFIDLRKSDAQFFAKLIQDNWDGIRTIPEEKKKILVANLDPTIAGTDLSLFRRLSILFALLLCGLAVLDRIGALVRLWRATRAQTVAP